MQANEVSPVLLGWKEIASYLGRAVRTVQRWESDFRLPVHRPADRPRGTVVSTKGEVDAWLNACPILKMYPHPETRVQSRPDLLGLIHDNIVTMHELREQMKFLRSGVRISRKLLRNQVVSVMEALHVTENNPEKS